MPPINEKRWQKQKRSPVDEKVVVRTLNAEWFTKQPSRSKSTALPIGFLRSLNTIPVI